MAKRQDNRYNKLYSKREIATIKKKTGFLQALKEKLGNIAAAAESSGVCRVSVFRWMREDPEFGEAVDEVRKATASVFESLLFKKIMAGDTTCLLYYLNHQGKILGYNVSEEVKVNITPIEPDMNVWKKWIDDKTANPVLTDGSEDE